MNCYGNIKIGYGFRQMTDITDTTKAAPLGSSYMTSSKVFLTERHPDGYNWPELEKADYHADLALTYYIKFFDMVLEKIAIARQATEASDVDSANHYVSEWDRILKNYVRNGATEEDLAKIEEILSTVPASIRTNYETMVAESEKVRDLMEDLSRKEYREAIRLAEEVQSLPNPMSGLTPEEYAEEEKRLSAARLDKSPPNTETETARKPDAFKIVIPKD